MYNQTEPTKTEGTTLAYERCYRRIKRRFCREAGVDDLTPNEIVANLILVKPSYAMSAWRFMKAAVLHFIEEHEPTYEQAAERLRQESSAGLRQHSNNTSGRKKKDVPQKIWKAMQKELRQRIRDGYRNSHALFHLLNATLNTGLRPNEWNGAEIRKHKGTGRPVLRVRNSKHTNGRANGAYREMFIDGLTDEELESVQIAIETFKTDDPSEAMRIQLAMRDELREVKKAPSIQLMERRGEGRVTTYSFRHQFLANAKLEFSDPVMVSALAGHISTKTAFEHYGARRNAHSRVRVVPTPESIEAVMKIKLETYQDFVANRKARPTLH